MNQITDRNPNDFSFGKSNAYAIGIRHPGPSKIKTEPERWKQFEKYTVKEGVSKYREITVMQMERIYRRKQKLRIIKLLLFH